jgi:predicted ATPase with chaperone activity
MTSTIAGPALARPEPLTLAQLGVNPAVVRDLALKTMYYRGRMTRSELADALKISGAAAEEVMYVLTRDALATVLSAEAANTSSYLYALTLQGSTHAEEAIARNGYVGPVPVALSDYIAQVQSQSIHEFPISAESLAAALGTLVLDNGTFERIGWAVASHKPMLIYGDSGNGKTTVARLAGAVVGGSILVPYAIDIVGQTVRVYDESKHERLEDDETTADESDVLRPRHDRRWVRTRRPVIWAGGELTRHSLELVYDTETKLYEAPLQLKANGGTLLIDDLGRQQIAAVDLLNRWIVALEARSDHLTLHTGQTIEVPFDVLLMFSTNLPPQDLADEAFLRRIRYKVEIPLAGRRRVSRDLPPRV